jgi:uncharacterized protein
MTDETMYHQGMRSLQDLRDTRPLADRLEQVTVRFAFTPEDRTFISSRSMMFVATADAQGHPECSYKGGLPGFVRVLDDRTLAFPDYDGNGMFKSLGNLAVNPEVAMLFVSLHGKPHRLRVNGTASIDQNDPLLKETVGAQMIVRVAARVIFPNCPRYIPTMQFVEPSPYLPRPGKEPVEPAWKSFDTFKDDIHPRQPTWKG